MSRRGGARGTRVVTHGVRAAVVAVLSGLGACAALDVLPLAGRWISVDPRTPGHLLLAPDGRFELDVDLSEGDPAIERFTARGRWRPRTNEWPDIDAPTAEDPPDLPPLRVVAVAVVDEWLGARIEPIELPVWAFDDCLMFGGPCTTVVYRRE